ncbi:MAG TPA: PLP-dependent aminotransferase family protein [Candidatus Obscuribacterales bacterium]
MSIDLQLDHNSAVLPHRQISDAIRQAIIEGKLSASEVLPPVRTLAQRLGVSRATVLRSYGDLVSQGYLDAAPGRGTLVAVRSFGPILPASPEQAHNCQDLMLSPYGQRLIQGEGPLESESGLAVVGRPPIGLVPINLWKDLICKHLSHRSDRRFATDRDEFGLKPLREAYCAYVRRARAVNCAAENVVVFSSRELRLNLLCRLLLEEGDIVAVENPGLPRIRQRLWTEGANVVPVRTDFQGLDVDQLKTLPSCKLVYVTPSHNEPTGAVMSPNRRRKLLDWAADTGAFIIEDDCDSEFRYDGRPLPSLQALDTKGSVIHISDCWKILAPVLKLGFMVVPDCLIEPVRRAKAQLEQELPAIDQLALTDFINNGHYEKSIRRLRSIYASRRKTTVDALKRSFGNSILIAPESAGLNITVRFRSTMPDREIVQLPASRNLLMIASQPYYAANPVRGEFVIPFAQLEEQEIAEGIKMLSAELLPSALE